MSTSSARHEAPRNGRPVKRRLIRVLAGSAVIGAMAAGGLQFALGTAYAAGDVCDLCSTNYNPVACCSSGGSAYDSNPGGGIDVSAQKAAFDSYCANYKKEHAQKEEPATPAPATKPSNPKQSAPAPAKPSTGNTTAQQSQPAQSTGTQSGQSTTGSAVGITGDTAANANADATATQTSKDAASRKNSDDNTADTAGGETTTTESGITDGGTDTAETTTQASPVTDRAETTSPVVRIIAGVVIALAVIGTLGAALIARNKRRAPALAGANGGRSDDGFDIADGATPAPATTANVIAATEARADASAPTEVLQPIASPTNGPSAGPSASLNVADSGGAPTTRYDFNLVDGPSSR